MIKKFIIFVVTPALHTCVPELHSVLSGLKNFGLNLGQVAFLPVQLTLFRHSLLCMHIVLLEEKLHELSQHGPWLGLHCFPGLSLHLFVS